MFNVHSKKLQNLLLERGLHLNDLKKLFFSSQNHKLQSDKKKKIIMGLISHTRCKLKAPISDMSWSIIIKSFMKNVQHNNFQQSSIHKE